MIREERTISIRDSYDVIVAGGGIAGVAAALAAKRAGARTIIIEKSTMMGGLATLGLVAIYLPLCDGNGHQVTYGIAEELLKLSGKYGYSNIPEGWTEHKKNCSGRYMTDFSPAAFVIAIDELLESESIDISYDTLVCDTVREGKAITHVIVENKSGRYAYGCKAVVDATGDADLFYRAGAPCMKGDNGLSYWTYSIDPEKLKTADKIALENPNYWLNMGGAHELGYNSPTIKRRYDGTDDIDVTDFIIDGRRCIRDEIYENGKRKDRIITSLPGMAQFRTTRHIVGEYVLDDIDENRKFEDSIGTIGDWRFAGPIWQIPYRALYTEKISNMFAAGRIISAQGMAWQNTRVIPAAALTGQASGIAATMCARLKVEAWDLDYKEYAVQLSKQGIRI